MDAVNAFNHEVSGLRGPAEDPGATESGGAGHVAAEQDRPAGLVSRTCPISPGFRGQKLLHLRRRVMLLKQ